MKKHECCGAGRPALPELADRLRRRSRKLTGAREAILRVLRDREHPLTTREIHAALGADRCDLVTIYRSMHLLEGMGIVQRFDFGDGVARYELVGASDGHHHHLICRECLGVVEIHACFPRELEEAIARQNGFKGISHKLEFFGICPSCQ